MSDILLREDSNAVASLTLNAPNKLNALSEEMMAALQSELDSIAIDISVRAVIIKGTGKAFCAGHDLKQLTAARQSEDGGKAYFNGLFTTCGKLMRSITKLPQPVIAQVHGIATAAGCQLVASCDMAVAAHSTRFGVNGVNIGLFCSTPQVALKHNILLKQSFYMLTTGEFIYSDYAFHIVLLKRAVPAESVDAATLRMIKQNI
mgnify:CR=1 FL=1